MINCVNENAKECIKMSWEEGATTKLNHQEVAEQVLQIYTKSLQDPKNLKSILSECCVLDYFGKVFYGHEKVASHLISNLHGSSYELSSLSISDQPSLKWNPISSPQDNSDDNLGFTLISPLKTTFPSITFTTPVRCFSHLRKRSASEALTDDCNGSTKTSKTGSSDEQSNSKEWTVEDHQNMQLSPEAIEAMLCSNIKYLTAYGTIRYPKRVLPSMDLKRIKHHSLVSLRGNFCQLSIGFKCDEHLISITNCKIWTIKYSFSSKVTPRNLLKAFNEVDDS